jgi:hypothetical protein
MAQTPPPPLPRSRLRRWRDRLAAWEVRAGTAILTSLSSLLEPPGTRAVVLVATALGALALLATYLLLLARPLSP